MTKGVRIIKGKHYLMAGRYRNLETAKDASRLRAAEGFYVRVIKLGLFDYALYEFPKDKA